MLERIFMERKNQAPSSQKEIKRQRIDELVGQARQNGYVPTTPAVPQQVQNLYRHWCKQQRQPAISVQVHDVYATLTIDARTAIKGWESAGMIQRGDRGPQLALTPGMAEQLSQWTTYYLHRSPAQSESLSIGNQELVLRHILAEDVDQAVREFLLLWAPARQEYEAQLETRQQVRCTEILGAPAVEPAWKSALTRASAPDCPPIPSCDHVTVPEHLPTLITKEHLCAFLGLPMRTGERKATLVAQLFEILHHDGETKARFFEVFVEEIAVEPWELEKLLGCTTSERKRWVSDGKLVPLTSRSVRKSGRELVYPVFDRRDVAKITPEIIAHFRNEHASLVALRRKTGARTAQESRVKYAEARKLALKEVEDAFGEWTRLGSLEMAAVLRLAFWTQMASRWAKENQAKSVHATKYGALYRQRMNEWYQRKDEALRVLVCSSYAHLSYYRPEDADKIELVLCEAHYDGLREGYYDGKWDFYASNQTEIHACPACHVSISHEYYALYAVEISAPSCPTWTFSFHIPQPIGKAFLPPARALPKVLHIEQEGLFRFGRRLYAEEKILYREKDVATHLAQALTEACSLSGLSDR
jgi:hypothetical protein